MEVKRERKQNGVEYFAEYSIVRHHKIALMMFFGEKSSHTQTFFHE